MIRVRRSDERGSFDFGWLDTRHTFSFGEYHDRRFMRFRSLRVINEDRVAPGAGFPAHPHKDMEILTVVLEGALRHEDSMGNGAVIRPGEVQRMTAGTGVRHSEFNADAAKPVHLLQIWILPEREALEPGYEQKAVDTSGRLALVASRDGRAGSVRLHQDADVYGARLAAGAAASLALRPGRGAWVQVARGRVAVNGVELSAGDGASAEDTPRLEFESKSDSEFLVFDLA